MVLHQDIAFRLVIVILVRGLVGLVVVLDIVADKMLMSCPLKSVADTQREANRHGCERRKRDPLLSRNELFRDP